MNVMFVLAQAAEAAAGATGDAAAAATGAATSVTDAAGGAAGAAGAAKEAPPAILQWMPLILGFVILYFFVFRKPKTERKRLDMLNELKKGARVQTIGGMRGTVIDVRDDDTVVVKVDENSNTKIQFARNAIHKVLEDDKK